MRGPHSVNKAPANMPPSASLGHGMTSQGSPSHPLQEIHNPPNSIFDIHVKRNPGEILRGLTQRWKSFLPGIVLCALVGLGARYVGQALPALGSATSAILMGLIVGNLFKISEKFSPGIRFCEKKVLELAVACMGFSLSLQLLSQLGWTAVGVILAAVTTALGTAVILSRFVKLPNSTVWLIGVGTAICGSSAIAAAAPLIAKDRKDIGISVGVVSILGILGIFEIPMWAQLLGFDMEGAGLMVGGTLQAVGHVVAAGFTMGDDVGGLAVTIKMGRVAMLIPLVLYLTMNQKDAPSSGRGINVPWYLVAFLVAATVVSMGLLPVDVVGQIEAADKLLLTIAMAAIGLSIHFAILRKQASKALLYGAIIWVVQIAAVSTMVAL